MNVQLGLCLAVVFFILKMIESKYITKEKIDNKDTLKNTLIVFISSVCGLIIYEKINPLVDKKSIQVFTSEPKF